MPNFEHDDFVHIDRSPDELDFYQKTKPLENATASKPAGIAAINNGGRTIRPKSRTNRAQCVTALSRLRAAPSLSSSSLSS
jgi:hypothetical protein